MIIMLCNVVFTGSRALEVRTSGIQRKEISEKLTMRLMLTSVVCQEEEQLKSDDFHTQMDIEMHF